MRLLVTGGAGYIGSVVVRHLIQAGHSVTVLDSLTTGSRSVLSPDSVFVHSDFADRETLKRCLPSQDAVLHFAASISVAESMETPMRYFHNNTLKTISLLEAMLEYGVTKFIFSSTAALYGQPRAVPVKEDHPLQPLNPYGESKLMVERVLEWLHHSQGLSYASLRYFNAAGGDSKRRKSVNLIPIVLDVARGLRSHLEIFGTDFPTRDGTAVRDYIHVEDLATAHLLALEALGSKSQMIYNLGSEKGATVQEVVQTAREITGKEIPIRYSHRRPGDPAEMIASSAKISAQLGWKACCSDLESIVRTSWSLQRTF